jgi:hypothetical protein
MFSLTDPPNPNQYLNRTFADAPPGQPSALRGREFFLDSVVFNNNRTCDDCHDEANFGPGSNREMVHRDSILEPQDLKVPQLRNLYRKVGFRDSAGITTKRGFGFSHDGSDDNLFRFLNRPQFTFSPDPTFADEQRRDMEAYLLAFDTGIAPAVGYELTFIGTNNSDPVALARVDTLKGQADLNYCDLVARGRSTSQPRGYYYLGADLWKPDKVAEGNLTTTQLIATAGDRTELTILGVPKGSGQRMGNDRDGDTYLDGDERDVLSDPGNFYATPLNTGVENGPGTAAPKFALRSIAPNPFRQFTEIAFSLGRPGRVEASVYDVLGRETASLARGTWFQAGDGHLRWDGRDRSGHAAAAGVYFVRVKTDAGLWTRPVVRLW